MKKNHQNLGFTLAEILVIVAIFALVIGAVYSAYALSQRAYREGEKAAELIQNCRVILERMSREIRQAREIVTELPDALDSEIPPTAASTIEFEDGHIGELYHYIRYFKDGNNIKREIIGYYFSGDPEQSLQPWDAVPPIGQTVETKIIQEPKTIGEYITDLQIWGLRVVNISLTLTKDNKQINLSTKIFGRNL